MTPRVPILLAALTSVAAAPEPVDIAHCTAIDSDPERLACYDKLFARPDKKAQEQPNAVGGVAAAEATAAQASADIDDFGLDGRTPGEQPTAPKGPDEIQGRITTLATQPRGEYVLTLDNGQVWQQQEYDWHWAFKMGDEVIIKRGLMKSYRLQLKGNNRTTPVTRIR